MPEPLSSLYGEILKGLREILSPRVSVTIFIVSLTLLIMAWWNPVGWDWLSVFVAAKRVPVFLVCITSGVFTITYPASWVWAWQKKKNNDRSEAKARLESIQKLHKRLTILSLAEKHVLQWFLERDSRTYKFDVTYSEGVDSLVASGILHNTRMVGVTVTYLIVDEAWAHLKENPSLIATPDKPKQPKSPWN